VRRTQGYHIYFGPSSNHSEVVQGSTFRLQVSNLCKLKLEL
jgi:hypothetical protein